MSSSDRVSAFAPATLSNLGSGFDVLGLALESPGDRVTAHLGSEPGVRLRAVRGDGGRLPRNAEANTATIAARALLERAADSRGVELELDKGLPLASGLGSSAASAAAAVVAVDALLGLASSPADRLAAVLEAEAVACGAAHPDNAAPCLYGGWVLIRPSDPPEVLSLPVPAGLTFAVVRPHVEVATRRMREILPRAIPREDAKRQWGNLAALVTALHRGDLELLGRAMVDHVAEPHRAPHVPGFATACRAARGAGALAVGLSGSGPSVFALCPERGRAEVVGAAMAAALGSQEGLRADVIVSGVHPEGARIVERS